MRSRFVSLIISLVLVICLSAVAVEKSSDSVTESAKQVPVVYDVVVVVAGVGTSGAIAAILSAGEGARSGRVD